MPLYHSLARILPMLPFHPKENSKFLWGATKFEITWPLVSDLGDLNLHLPILIASICTDFQYDRAYQL